MAAPAMMIKAPTASSGSTPPSTFANSSVDTALNAFMVITLLDVARDSSDRPGDVRRWLRFGLALAGRLGRSCCLLDTTSFESGSVL